MKHLWATLFIILVGLFWLELGVVSADSNLNDLCWPTSSDQLTSADWGESSADSPSISSENYSTSSTVDATPTYSTVEYQNTVESYPSTDNNPNNDYVYNQASEGKSSKKGKKGKGISYGTPLTSEEQEQVIGWIEKYAQEYNLPVETMRKLAYRESKFRPDAYRYGSKGVMQIIPKYHRQSMSELNMSEHEIWNAEKNIQLGCHILRKNLNATGSLKKALRRYARGYR